MQTKREVCQGENRFRQGGLAFDQLEDSENQSSKNSQHGSGEGK